MPFPRRLLADHEKLVFDLKPHWVAVIPSVLWTLVLLAALIFGLKAADDQSGGVRLAIVGVALALWAWLAVNPFLQWIFTRFVLTSDRLITRSGVIAKHSKEIPLERINDVTFTQTILDRALGAGDLLVESAGERGQTKISNVRKPEQVQLMIYKETESNSTRIVTGQHGNVERQAEKKDSIPEQLEALARLRDQGVISDMEFENKKQDLLKRM